MTQSVGQGKYLPLISVIIPVYNTGKVVERCVKSVREQIYPNLEIILVDDGSTDMSGAFCDLFARQDPRIKVIHQSNQGLSAARNAGLKVATGKWVTFVDSDDTIRRDMIDILHKICFTHKLKLSICGFQEIFPSKEVYGTNQPEQETVMTTLECLKAMLCEEGFSMSAWGKLYARELFDLVKFPERRLYEDVGTTYQLVLQCDHIGVTTAKAYNYYQTAGSITQQGFNLHKMDLIDLTDQMCDELITWGKNLPEPERQQLLYLTKKRRVHARFSILRQIVMVDKTDQAVDQKSLHHAEQNVVKYLRKHKNDILKNPLASRRDKLAMRSLQLGLPAFKFAWQKYAAKHKT